VVARLPILTLAIFVVVGALAFVAGGCGGGDDADEPEGTPPRQWVTSVCGALDRWQTSLQDKAQTLPREVLQAASPTDAKQRIGNFLGEVIAETDAMIARVDKAGEPAVDEGRRISADVHTRLLKVKAAFEGARERVEKVPTNDPLAFQRQLTEIGQDLLAQGESLGDILRRADAKPIQDALREDERCAAFRGN
jgi:hypothetical protein